MEEPCRIRPADSADAAALLELERACFSDPWSEMGLQEVLATPTTIALVAEKGLTIAGYAIARAVVDSAEILTLGVHPGLQRQGIASHLLQDLLGRLSSLGVTEVWLEVRVSNTAARTLYQSRQFRITGMRRAYYRLPTEDALLYRLQLPDDA